MLFQWEIDQARKKEQKRIRKRGKKLKSNSQLYFKCLTRDNTSRAIMTTKCPFCSNINRWWLWGGGKRCECGAKFNFFECYK